MPDSAPRSLSIFRWLIVILAVLILGVIVYRLATPNTVSEAAELRQINIVPPFALTERSGRTITNQDLRGKIWVADFIYTTCPGPCPIITAGMVKVQAAVARDSHVQLVTFTVDPQDDTPAVLAAYANRFGANPNRWWFLTGPEKQIDDLIENGFYQVVQDNRGQPLQPGQFLVTHSTRLVLVDANGVVRGAYDGIGDDGRADLLAGIKTLEKEDQ
ncbi:MAG TPA: SCO family protein [Candidatus Methylacidiphilales bacterium]|nr:SCO family protein [Candidatus Methylacidiphilales bacterium]